MHYVLTDHAAVQNWDMIYSRGDELLLTFDVVIIDATEEAAVVGGLWPLLGSLATLGCGIGQAGWAAVIVVDPLKIV